MCRDVADEVGLPRPNAVATGTAQLERQMFALANTTLKEMGRYNWPMLQTVFEFPTVIGQETYAVPADLKRFITDTAYVASLYYQMRGSLTGAEWEKRRNQLPSAAGRYRYRVFGSPYMINIQPIPQLVEQIVMEYFSSFLALDGSNIPIPLYGNDADMPRMPEEIVQLGVKWRIKHAKGLDYSQDFNEYYAELRKVLAQRLGLGSVAVAYRWNAETPELGDGYIPEQGFGP
jgi:hypothetical protein